MKIETITSRELLADCAQRTSGSHPGIPEGRARAMTFNPAVTKPRRDSSRYS
ncbi:MAG: hypothetical protein IPN47_21190 [Gemmatimonadetes bacterium]|jgi:hypothetical protein|nr:hypothetical protein [Gemmatimonadota bacterium]